jgi:thiol-disulfide isomerase/thioredoxin
VVSRPFPRALVSLLLIAGLAVSCGSDGALDPTALEFSAPDLDGQTVDAVSFEGSDTVLWFWAPWCTVCRAEAPAVVEVAAGLDDEIEIVGVAGRGSTDEMRAFVSDTETNELRHVVDESGDIWSAFEVSTQPAFAFIDDDGSVDVHVGPLGAERLQERIDDLQRS